MARLSTVGLLVSGLLLMAVSSASAAVVTTDASKVPAGTYQIDGSHASAAGRLDHLGFSATTIRFAKISGEVTYDPARQETPKLDVAIDTASLSTDWPARDDELRGAMFFNVAKFPTINFTATSLKKTGGDRFKVIGKLTLLGVTKPVELDAVFKGFGTGMMGDERLGFEAKAKINRSEFGMASYIPAVGDTVEILIDAEFTKKK